MQRAVGKGIAFGQARQYALAPELAPLLPIFNAGKMGVLLNVGTLIGATTKLPGDAGTGCPQSGDNHDVVRL